MSWLRVTVRATQDSADAVGEILRRAGCSGWENPLPDVVVGYIPSDERADARVAGVWEEVRALAQFGLDPGSGDVSVEVIEERAWEEVWKAYFHPTRVGRLVVCPTWEETELAPGEVLIRLDPGMAFGSGAHATTRLCLAAVQDALPEAGRVLDVGTGSGILAIAAARLGASRVLAIDNDPDVIAIARENAERNEVAGRIEVRDGDIFSVNEGNWDVVLANIAPDPVKDAASHALTLLAPGGVFVGGGIPAGRADEVACFLAGVGFTDVRILREDEWVAVVCRRTP